MYMLDSATYSKYQILIQTLMIKTCLEQQKKNEKCPKLRGNYNLFICYHVSVSQQSLHILQMESSYPYDHIVVNTNLYTSI